MALNVEDLGYKAPEEPTSPVYDPVDLSKANFSDILSHIDDYNPEQLMKFAIDNPEFAEKYPSFIDTLINQGYSKRNFDYEYEKNNDISYLMSKMKEAGINPILAFRNSLNTGTMASSSSGFASDLSRKASLEETKAKNQQSHQEFILGILKAFGVAFLGALLLA